MATTKVSALTELTSTTGSEEVLINDGGTSKKITIANLTKGHDLPTVPSGITTDTNKEYNLKLTDVSGTETLTWIEETDNDTTYSTATATTEGLVKIEDAVAQTVAANTVTATASRTYGVQLNASDQAVVNVPWTAATGIDDVSGVARATSGLLFNSDTAAANVLDDYEEGTWTPVPLFGGGNGITGSFTGTYVKIGRQVTAKYKLTFTGLGSSTGAFTCTGLPYTTAGSRGNTSGFSYMHRLAQSSYTQIYLYVVSTSIGFEQAGFSSSNASALDNTDFTTSTDFRGSVIYETNS